MRFIADLHIHSKYSRATSRDMSPETIWRWAQLKGITVIGTGDFTHAEWRKELSEKLEPAGHGLFTLKSGLQADGVPLSCRSDVLFLLSAEISCIYSKKGKTRKVHSILFAPDLAAAEKISHALSRIGNLRSDGRPILGLDAKELLNIVLENAPEAMLVPAHVWTPHFSVFGAASGFDSLEECYEDLTSHIFALETGLSSDPAMNWRLSALDSMTLISNSDAHSPAKIGREANIFDTEVSYPAMREALKTGRGFTGTVEFFPEEGKYHYDGHRACGVNFSPRETKRHHALCPVCGKKLTVGVMHRVDDLADREESFRPPNCPDFHSIVPLPEILAEILKVGQNSKKVNRAYLDLIEKLGPEFHILMDASIADIAAAGSSPLAEAVSRMRAGKISIVPGFDGEYGKIRLLEKIGRKEVKGHSTLF